VRKLILGISANISNKDQFEMLISAYADSKTFEELILHALIFGNVQDDYLKTEH
jgi:hypothetical protein